jgi:hypothetical protein
MGPIPGAGLSEDKSFVGKHLAATLTVGNYRIPGLHPVEHSMNHVTRKHSGKPLPILLGKLTEFGGQPCQCVALVDPFAFVALVGIGGLWRRTERSGFEGIVVCVFAFAGANPGANRKRR